MLEYYPNTPYPSNQNKKNTKREKKLLKKRKIIETVIGQLKDHFRVDHLRAIRSPH
jgi:hypothetical protein